MEPQPCVYLVDDDPFIRDSLRVLMKSVGLPLQSYASAQELLEKVDPQSLGCLILDVRLPGMSGLDLQQKLREKGIDLPIIVISGHADVQMTVRAIKTGAMDFLEKPFNDQQLLDRVHEALLESQNRRKRRDEVSTILERVKELTPREREVLDLIATGMSNKAIALHLEISRKTLDIHRSKVVQKMEAESIADVVRMAMQMRHYLQRI